MSVWPGRDVFLVTLPVPGAGRGRGIWAQGPPGLGMRNPSIPVCADPQLLRYGVMACIPARGDPLLLAVSLLPLQPSAREKVSTLCPPQQGEVKEQRYQPKPRRRGATLPPAGSSKSAP